MLEAEQGLAIKWYVDVSFAVHPDMQSHTGATMTLGKGAVYSILTEITQPCIHTCDGLFICQLYSLPDLLEETKCKEDTPLTLPFASFDSLSQLIIVI
jgi:hypothetical protein